jgi:hypothetical protein
MVERSLGKPTWLLDEEAASLFPGFRIRTRLPRVSRLQSAVAHASLKAPFFRP